MVCSDHYCFGADIGVCRNVEDYRESAIAPVVTIVTNRSHASFDDIDRDPTELLRREFRERGRISGGRLQPNGPRIS